MSIKGFTKRLSFKRSSRDEIPVADQATTKLPQNGYLSPEELEGTDSVPDKLVEGSHSLRRVQSSKTARSHIAPEMNRYSLPTIFNDSERPKSGNARVNGSSLVSHSASKQGGTSTTNGDEHHRSISRTVSASAMSTMESPSKTSLTASSSTSSLISGKPLYMPSATRRQRRISLNEIGYGREKTYQKLEKLGEGTYATVYKGRSTITSEYVALKEIRLEYEEGAPCTAIREVSLLKDLKHANIVCLHDIIHTNRSLTLVFEYVDQDLKQYLDRCNGIMSITNVRLFLFQLLRGLEYCHKRKVLHRDIKPQNLLISEAGDLKLADFGLARAKSVPTKTYSNEVVTLWYRPPEVLLGSIEYNSEIDMWGVGCIFYEMLIGKPMFPGASVEEELELIFKYLGTPTEESWPGITKNEDFIAFNFPYIPPVPLGKLVSRLDGIGVDLMYKFLCYQAKNRLQAEEAMHHPFFECLGKRVFDIHNTMSIFVLPECDLAKNPGHKDHSLKRERHRSAYN